MYSYNKYKGSVYFHALFFMYIIESENMDVRNLCLKISVFFSIRLVCKIQLQSYILLHETMHEIMKIIILLQLNLSYFMFTKY